MIKTILSNPEILRKHNESVTLENTPNLSEIIQDLKDTLNAHPIGLGLTANQIGYNKKVSFIKYWSMATKDKAEVTEKIFINAKVIAKNNRVTFKDEGCLSFPGLHIDTDRYSFIVVEYQNEQLETQQEIFQGVMAIVLQHEIQHQNSKIMMDSKHRR